jgi:hypothetical protein
MMDSEDLGSEPHQAQGQIVLPSHLSPSSNRHVHPHRVRCIAGNAQVNFVADNGTSEIGGYAESFPSGHAT